MSLITSWIIINNYYNKFAKNFKNINKFMHKIMANFSQLKEWTINFKVTYLYYNHLWKACNNKIINIKF